MAITVTAAQSGTGTSPGLALTVKVITGQASNVIGATATSSSVTTPELAITPAGTGSWVYGALGNDNATGTFTADAATTFTQNQYLAAAGQGLATFRSAGTTTAATPVTLGASAPTGSAGQFQIALLEIRAASGGTLAEDASSPAAVYTTTATTATTGAFTAPAGALLVATVSSQATGTSGQAMTIAVSDTSGLTWTRQAAGLLTAGTATQEITSVWTAQVPSGGSGSGGTLTEYLSVSTSGPGDWGEIALRFSGTAGTGATASATAAQTLALTTNGDNSAVVALVLDWNAVDGSSRTWATVNGTTPTAANGYELAYALLAATYTIYAAYWPDAGAAGTNTFGLSSPSGTTKPTILLAEILAVQVPSAATGAATSVTASGATLNGTVNPEGSAATWQFEYGPTTSYGTLVPASAGSAGSGTTAVAESYALSGLPPSTTYHYRLNASSSSGTSHGADQAFTTSSSTAPAGGGATPQPGTATIIIEAALTAAPPVQGLGVFTLDTSTLDTGALGSTDTWTEITAWARSATFSRPADRQQGPLYAHPPGTATIILNNKDGRFDPDNTAGPYAPGGTSALTAMVPVRIRAAWNGTTWPLWQGYADSWDDDGRNYAGRYAETTLAATDAQKVLAGITIPASTPAGAGEDTGTRIGRILDDAGWYTGTALRDIDAGTATVQATAGGDTAWALMQAAADAEIGDLYLNGAGAVVFRNRDAPLTAARSATSQAAFSDDGTALPYTALTRARDDTTIANDIQATTTADGAALQRAQDAASITKYLFPRSYARSDLILESDAAAAAWAQWILYVAATDEDRFDQITITPRRDPGALWPAVLAAETGDRITITRNPPGLASPVTKDCLIRGISHDITIGGDWTVTWTLQDASKYASFLTLDNTTTGQLDHNALA